eukprot:jgi/Tetstr1/424322/TSEL_014889.t1
MTRHLLSDLEWCAAVPPHNNSRSIDKPLETAYMHVESSGYGDAIDCLRLSDGASRREHTPLWGLIDDLVIKPQTSGAAATVIAPYKPDMRWH